MNSTSLFAAAVLSALVWVAVLGGFGIYAQSAALAAMTLGAFFVFVET